jgi:hypothetical protein
VPNDGVADEDIEPAVTNANGGDTTKVIVHVSIAEIGPKQDGRVRYEVGLQVQLHAFERHLGQ